MKKVRLKNCVLKNERGVLSIEAAIALTTFLFVFITIYSIITICRAQAHVQVAINSTAKEISQYSYIYALSGLDQSLSKFQTSAGETKDQINNTVSNIAGVFENIQSIGSTAQSLNFSDPSSLMDRWGDIKSDLNEAKDDYSAVKEQIEGMAEDPQSFLFGLARLIGSEGLELAKSRAIAEPVCRALVKKHLKRNNNDTAEQFCASIGILPGTYFGKESYYNGLDFSNSTLFAYGSDEIVIVVTYKVKIIQLLPIDLEYTITQTAVTRGWLHGDKTASGAGSESRIKAIESKPGRTIWNSTTLDERLKLIRDEELDELKSPSYGYESVSGFTYVQAYNMDSNTFVMITSSDPVYDLESVDQVDKKKIKESIEKWASQITSSTDNVTSVKVKRQDEKGNFITVDVPIDENEEIRRRVRVVIPEDEGLYEIYEQAVSEYEGDVIFEIVKKHGTGFKRNEDSIDSGSTGNDNGGAENDSGE